MAVKPGNSSIFVGKKEFEIMKKPGRGTNGHIAILTNNVDRAIYHLSQRGVKFDMDSKNVGDGKTVAIYFADEVAGFAFHLVQSYFNPNVIRAGPMPCYKPFFKNFKLKGVPP